MCGSLVQNVGYLLELTAPTVEAAMAAVTVENVGSAFVPLCYCWFIYIYCYAAPPKRLLRTLAAVNFLVLPTVFFNWGGLFYRDFQWLSAAEGFHYISITYGPLYTLFMFTRIIIPYVLCFTALVRAIRMRSDREVNRQYQTILFISTLPVVMLAAYVFKLFNVFDLTPVTLAIAMSMVVIVVWSRRNYDFRRLAAEKVLESLGDGSPPTSWGRTSGWWRISGRKCSTRTSPGASPSTGRTTSATASRSSGTTARSRAA